MGDGSWMKCKELKVTMTEFEKAKLALAIQLEDVVKRRKLSKDVLAGILGVERERVEELLGLRLQGFSLDDLMRYLNLMGQDVNILVRNSRSLTEGKIEVLFGDLKWRGLR